MLSDIYHTYLKIQPLNLTHILFLGYESQNCFFRRSKTVTDIILYCKESAVFNLTEIKFSSMEDILDAADLPL